MKSYGRCIRLLNATSEMPSIPYLGDSFMICTTRLRKHFILVMIRGLLKYWNAQTGMTSSYSVYLLANLDIVIITCLTMLPSTTTAISDNEHQVLAMGISAQMIESGKTYVQCPYVIKHNNRDIGGPGDAMPKIQCNRNAVKSLSCKPPPGISFDAFKTQPASY